MTNSRTNRPSQDMTLKVLQWNCGGLSQQKKTELLKILADNNIDIFILIEANKLITDLERFQFPGYIIHLLEKSRQIASGIMVGVKSHLITDFRIVKNMNNASDKMELANINV